VSTDDSFNGVIDTRIVKGTRYSPPTTYDNDQYWWQVRARNIFGATHQWSDRLHVPIRQFRRAWLTAPTLLHPANTVDVAASDDLYYQWTPARLATRYRLDVGSDPNFSPTTFQSCYTTQTTYTPGFINQQVPKDACMPAPGATKYWRVQALDGPRSPEVNGIKSETSTFVYDPGRVTQLAPANQAVVAVPTLRWAPAQDAEKYNVRLSWSSGGSFTTTTHSSSWTPTGATKLPVSTAITWTVQSVDHNNDVSPMPLPFGGGRTFSISGALPTTGAPALTPLTPTAGAQATARSPELSWEPLTAAAYYKVYVGTAGSSFREPMMDRFGGEMKFPYPAATDETTKFIAAGSYDWFVAAYNSTGVFLQSGDSARFTVKHLPSAAGQRVALDGSGVDAARACTYQLDPASGPAVCSQLRATPVLDWASVPDAGYYMVYVSRDREMTNLVFGQASNAATIPRTQNTRWTPLSALADSQAGDAYYWFIRPCKTLGKCAPDPTTAGHAFNKRSNKVEATGPVPSLAGPAEVANDVTFTWKDYLKTQESSAHLNPTTGEQASQAAHAYHLQVATSPAFTSTVDDVTVDQTTYTAFGKTYPEGLLYWRIQAIDGSNNGLAWSDPIAFTKKSPQVVLESPIGGISVTSTKPFKWEPRDFAASYDIEVYKNKDTTASPINRVLTTNSKQVAYTMTTPLPVAKDYIWRVRRVDADGLKGTWSVWSYFSVVGGVQRLGTPLAGESVSGTDTLFTWTGVAGASSYKFERRATGSTVNAETVTTVALAWAPTSVITNGTWQWRVTAIDSNGQPLGESAWRDFRVDGVPPAVSSKSPVAKAKLGVNFVANFSEPVVKANGATMKLFVRGQQHSLPAVVTMSNLGKRATLNPSGLLIAGKVYTVRLSTAITDRAGNTLPATSWQVTAVR
jgi:hypothetical protein